VHGPCAQLELEASNVTGSPVTGELGANVKLAIGAALGTGAEATAGVAAELAEAAPPSLCAVTTTRIMCPVSAEPSV